MIKSLAGIVTAVTVCAAAGVTASAQSPEEILAEDMRRNEAAVQAVVGQTMQDPQVQAAYQQHLAQGGGGTFYDYALWWAQTAGGARVGQWNDAHREINARRAAELRAYRDWQRGVSGDVSRYRSDSHDARSDDVGGVLRGMHRVQEGGRCWMVPDVAGGPPPYEVNCRPAW